MKKHFSFILLSLGIVFFMVACALFVKYRFLENRNDKPSVADVKNKVITTDRYEGELGFYEVHISDELADGVLRHRNVVIVNKNFQVNVSPIFVAGADLEGDGRFDILEIAMNSDNSSLVVYFEEEGRNVYPREEGQAIPTTIDDNQLAAAQALLYTALASVRNQDHLVRYK